MEITTAILAAQPFLKGLPDRHLELLVRDAMSEEFTKGEWIFREGHVANYFYIIRSGQVALHSPAKMPGEGRDETLIETIRAGSVLGWSWLFPPYSWRFDAEAVTRVKAIFFYGARLREQCEKDHELGYELMKRTAEVAIGRLQAARTRLSEQKFARDKRAVSRFV